MGRYLLALMAGILILAAITAHAVEMTLKWDPVEYAAGYKVYMGTASGTYGDPVNVENVTTHSMELGQGTYYFAVTAYNKYGESGYSNEVSCDIGPPETYTPPGEPYIIQKTETYPLVGGGEVSVTVTY